MQRIMPQPGTPAAELARLGDEEHQLTERESDMLNQGVEVEMRAREVQSQLDAARASLQRLANTSAHGDAERAFVDSLSLVVPPHVASPETSRALELRRKALIARLQAIEAEGQAVQSRASKLAEISEGIGRLQSLTLALAAKAEADRRAAAAAAQAPILLTPAAGQPTPVPPPTPAPAKKPQGPVYSAPPAAWSRGPTKADLVRDTQEMLALKEQRAAEQRAAEQRAAEQRMADQRAAEQRLAEQRAAEQRMAARKPATATPAPPAPVAVPPAPAPVPQRAADGLFGEARREARQRVQAEVTLGSESNFYTGFSGDLSEGGVFVATYEKLLPPGTAVEVALALPNRPPIKVTGKVKWVRETADHSPGVFPGMGIQFEVVQPEALSVIKSFLQRREPMFWDDG
ncbi:MAG: TIGR02266 family protein [Myxococcales bacterium]